MMHAIILSSAILLSVVAPRELRDDPKKLKNGGQYDPFYVTLSFFASLKTVMLTMLNIPYKPDT